MKLTVATYNIKRAADFKHQIETGEKIRNSKLYADFIRDEGIDICGMQEVCFNDQTARPIEGMDRNHVRGIAQHLGYDYVYGLAEDKSLLTDGGMGNAIVSRYPIVGWRTIGVPAIGEEAEDRVILVAEIDVEGTLLTVMNSHFGLTQEDRERAYELALRELQRIEGPVMLMGDLNMRPDNPLYEKFDAILPSVAPTDLLTFPSRCPNRQIDFIFASKEIGRANARVPAVLHSDHRPLLVDMEI